ncbi:hypothetical protein ColTof4_10548 [Colletotrichum tofieldiae]|nr:hypothetical protein ColTof4_10548 [Colletotrichum tofieldiae]
MLQLHQGKRRMHSLYPSSRPQEKETEPGLARKVGKMRGSTKAVRHGFDNAAHYPRNPVAVHFCHALVRRSVAQHTSTATTLGFRFSFRGYIPADDILEAGWQSGSRRR